MDVLIRFGLRGRLGMYLGGGDLALNLHRVLLVRRRRQMRVMGYQRRLMLQNMMLRRKRLMLIGQLGCRSRDGRLGGDFVFDLEKDVVHADFDALRHELVLETLLRSAPNAPTISRLNADDDVDGDDERRKIPEVVF